MKKRHLIKVPKNTSVLYDSDKRILVLIGGLKTKLVTVPLKINIIKQLNSIEITSNTFFSVSSNDKKKLKAIQGTTVSLIKQFLIEISFPVYRKLKFVGVGYRSFNVVGFENSVFMLKLGYSHFLYIKATKNIKIFCLKFTRLFIFGNSYQDVTQTASLIRSYKKPEPYKGKGILYEEEKVILKEGKKV